MSHDHDHSAHGHVHGAGNERALAIAAGLTGLFMIAEVAGGLISNSLALLADAGHMLTDFGALLMAWFALRLSRRPADEQRTYGFDRFSVLAAFVNGLALFVIAGWIGLEAWERLAQPAPVLGGVMLWVALAGLAVNILAFWVLTRGESENLNIRAAALHVVGDLLGSVAALAAALVIIWTGWTPIDPILSVLVAVIILKSAWTIVRESGHILLEGWPRGLDRGTIVETLKAELPVILDVSHVHAWSITQERPMVTMEVDVRAGCDIAQTRSHIRHVLKDRFHIDHATIEMHEDRETA